MIPYNDGIWAYHCHVNHHIKMGMIALYQVLPSTIPIPTIKKTGRLRKYFIAAEELTWDYAPKNKNEVTGKAFSTENELLTTQTTSQTVGTKYQKVCYVEYTDASFTKKKQRTKDWEHLGFLGPLIRAEVGDEIEVVFKNKHAYPLSLHPHGVFYKKDSEGAFYQDNIDPKDKSTGFVKEGRIVIYRWFVPEQSGHFFNFLSFSFFIFLFFYFLFSNFFIFYFHFLFF